MTAVFLGRGRRRRRSAVVLGVGVVFLSFAALAAEPLNVVLDQATITKLPEKVATIVIGNPLIADVTIQPGGLMVVTGKGYGATNFVALDRDGRVLMDRTIKVSGAQEDIVVVYRGLNRESYSCMPVCERRITLGDTPEFFDATLGQAGTRATRAGGAGGGGAQPSAQR